MGIRFYCPHCDRRLHVKDYLAGKRGICPHCDESIRIPQQSTISDDEADHESRSEVDMESPQQPAPESLASAGPAVPTEPPTVGQEPNKPTGGQVTGSNQAPSGATAGSAAAPESGLNPIESGEHLVWYVRPPSGGQYGPAEGGVMRQWLEEGRVTADSLVWQEGWDEWRQAGEVFADHFGSEARAVTSGKATGVEVEVVAAGSTRARGATVDGSRSDDVQVDQSKVKMLEYRLNRSRGKSKELTAIIVLTVVCVVLLVLLGFVITGRL